MMKMLVVISMPFKEECDCSINRCSIFFFPLYRTGPMHGALPRSGLIQSVC